MGLCRRARWRWLAAGSVPVTSWEPRARGSSGGSGGLPGAGHAPGLSAPGWAARLGWGRAASAASGPAGSSCPRMARAQRAPRPRRAPAAVRAVARGRLAWPVGLGLWVCQWFCFSEGLGQGCAGNSLCSLQLEFSLQALQGSAASPA